MKRWKWVIPILAFVAILFVFGWRQGLNKLTLGNIFTAEFQREATNSPTEKGVSVTSHGQAGGITAQNVVINMEDKPKPRALAPEQKKAILEFLAKEPKGAFVIKANITVPDALSYADQIAEPFRNSGWNVRIDNALISGSNVLGVWITIKNPEAVPPSCIVLKTALDTAGITTPAHYDPGVPDAGEVWLSIGSR